MMKLSKSISNCSGIKCIQGRLVQAINKEVFIGELKIENLTSVDSIRSFQNNLNYSSNSKLIEIERKSDEQSELIHITGADNLSILTKGLFLIHNRLSRKELKYSIVDQSKNVLWESVGNRFVTAFFGRLLVRNRLSHDEFWVLNTSGRELLHYKLPPGFNVFRNIELVNDTLFFISNKEGNSFLNVTGIDFNTGQIKWEYEYSIPYETSFIATTLHKDLLYGLSRKFFQTFDPGKGQFLIDAQIERTLPEGVSPDVNRQCVIDGKLWFVSGRGKNVSFGAFDIAKSELDFVQNHPLNDEDQYDTPVYYQEKLYLRALHSNTLHIFEKETKSVSP